MRCSRRKVHVLAPLSETAWLPAEQLGGGAPGGRGGCSPAERSPATAVCLEAPAGDLATGRSGSALEAWVEEASHWESDASNRSQLLEPQLCEPQLPERRDGGDAPGPSGAAAPMDAAPAAAQQPPPAWPPAQPRSAPAAAAGLPACPAALDSRAALTRAHSNNSSQSSMRSAGSSFLEGPQGAWAPAARAAAARNDVHAAARRSLEESARSAAGPRELPAAAEAKRKQRAKLGGLSRLFSGSLSSPGAC